jgi:hypothetical protein
VAHLTAELNYARTVIEGTDPGPWIDGHTTWPTITDTTEVAWVQALQNLKQTNRELVSAVSRLDDAILDKNPIRVPGPFYVMLHGTLQHNVYHAGQISLLAGQIAYKGPLNNTASETYIHGTEPSEQARLAALNQMTNRAFVQFLGVEVMHFCQFDAFRTLSDGEPRRHLSGDS